MSAVLETGRTRPVLEAIQGYWRQMKPREKRLTLIAGLLVLVAFLWWLALAPALRTLRQAPEQHRSLDAQIQAMQSMSSEAKTLQNQPRLGQEDAKTALQSSVAQRFGNTAQLSLAGERATLTLKNASPQELAQWLAQVRVNARVIPSEAKLNRSVNAAPPGDSTAGWDGTLVLILPKK